MPSNACLLSLSNPKRASVCYSDDERFRKEERLRKRSEFLKTQRKGQRRSGKYMVVYACPNGTDFTRIGLTVARKVGNSVTRSIWKRRLRETFRTHKQDFPAGYDFVVIVKAGFEPVSVQVLKEELLRLAVPTPNRRRRE